MGASENRKAALGSNEAFNRRDLEAIGELAAKDVVSHAIPEELGLGQGREAFVTLHRMQLDAFPDCRVEVLDTVAEDDMVATRVRMTGTHEGEFMGIPASGRTLDIEAAAFYRFNDDGEIVEHHFYADNLEFMQQIGAIPEEPSG